MSLKSIVQAYQSMYEAKKAAKDYDGDGKIESGTDEYMGSRDKAIKKAMAKKGMKKEEIENVFAEIEEHHQKDADGNVIEHDENPRPEEEIADDLAPASVEEGSVYGMYKGSGKPSGAMAAFAKKDKKKAPRMQKGAMAYDGPNKAASEAKDRLMAKAKEKRKNMGETLQSLLDTLEEGAELDKYDAVVAYLIDEQLAEDFDHAQKIMGTLKSELVEEIYRDQLWTLFDESREYSHNPEKYHDSKGYDKKLEKDKPYHKRSRAARMADPKRGINSPAFKKFMADRGMSM